MPREAQEPDQREALKGRRLEYLYQVSPDLAPYPLIGSAVRAIGKEWNVQVVSTSNSEGVFRGLKERLQNPGSLMIGTTMGNSSLVLVEGAESNRIKAIRDSVIGSSHVMVAGDDTNQAD